MRGLAFLALAAVVSAACAGALPDRCSGDDDCSGGVCQAVEGVRLCVDASQAGYAIAIDAPELVGRATVLGVHVKHPPGEPVTDLVARLRVAGSERASPALQASEDGYLLPLDLPEGGEDVELVVEVESPRLGLNARRELRADTLAPRLTVTGQGVTVRRGEPIHLDVTVEELHSLGLQAAITAAATDEPATWSDVPVQGGTAQMVLDASALPLPAIDGELAVHLRAEDIAHNVRLEVVAVRVTRRLLDVQLPARAAVAGPVALPDGDLLVPLEGDPWLARLDRGTGELHAIEGLPGFVVTGVVLGRERVLVVAGPALLQLDPLTLALVSSCDTAADPVLGLPLVGTSGGVEIAVGATASGTWTSFRGGAACTAVRGPTLHGNVGIARSDGEGLQVLAAGSGGSPAFTVLDVDPEGVMKAGRTLSGPAVHMPVAGDGSSVFGGDGTQALAFDLEGTPAVRSLALDAAITAPPVVTQDLVIYPTAAGLALLPRQGAWTEARTIALGPTMSTPAIATDGTIWVASGPQLHALREAQDGEAWSAPLPGNVVSPLLLGCEGELWVIAGERLLLLQTDGGGPDADAPWPLQHHDPGATGNVATDYCSSR